MQRSKEQIIDYFHKFIFGFIYHDIERCIEARANYVVALALLSYTEYIGGLITGNLGLKEKGIVKANFKEALSYFPEEYGNIDSSLEVEYKDEKGKEKRDKGIYGVFRCGMVHEYFIKGLLTTQVNNNPDGHSRQGRIGIEIKLSDSGKRLIFYTNEYFRDLRLAVDKIYKLLILDPNSILSERLDKSLDRIESRKIQYRVQESG